MMSMSDVDRFVENPLWIEDGKVSVLQGEYPVSELQGIGRIDLVIHDGIPSIGIMVGADTPEHLRVNSRD